MPGFDWGKLKDGFRGFEKLALFYVNKNFPNRNGEWEETQKTRDGNRDAYTVILGFQPYPLTAEQWWMEAKYSTKSKKLTRYRLDATIVSAILSGNVSKIIFVTNILISAKVISDIRKALKHSVNCNDVVFCSKNTLELWLYQNPQICKNFFINHEEISYDPPDLLVIEEMEYYSPLNQRMSFKEPLVILNCETNYVAHFAVFSKKDQICNLKPHKALKNTIEYHPLRLKLAPGDNQLQIDIKFSKNAYKSNWNPIFDLGGCKLTSKYHVNIIPQRQAEIEIKSQMRIIKNTTALLRIFETNLNPTICCIKGQSGVGKTHILNRILDTLPTESRDVYYIEFSSSWKVNNLALSNAVLFILFPYISPDDIDTDYLNAVAKGNYISNAVKKIVESRNSYESLSCLFSSLQENNEEELFSAPMKINRRYIVLDDIHKLNYAGQRFLFKLIVNVVTKKIPIFFLLCGQTHFYNNEYDLMKQRIVIHEEECALDDLDIVKFLHRAYLPKAISISSLHNNLFNNIIELFMFAKFLNILDTEIGSLQDFLIACHRFYIDAIPQQYFLDNLTAISGHSEELKQLINAIFWSSAGVKISYNKLLKIDYSEELLKSEFFSYKDGNHLIASHDIYTQYYRKTHKQFLNNPFIPDGKIEKMRYYFIQKNIEVDWQVIIDQLNNYYQKQQYHTIMYILEDSFSNEDRLELRGCMGNDNYYTLYMIYANVSTHLSITKSGKELFQKIKNETQNVNSLPILNVNESATWELLNSQFEWLEYEKALLSVNELVELVERLQKYGNRDPDINKCIRYHDATVIQTLIESELEEPRIHQQYLLRLSNISSHDFLHRALSFQVRYAQTLLLRDPMLAEELLAESRQELTLHYDEDEKYYLWATLSYYFIQLVFKKKNVVMKDIIEVHEKMKRNFYNDYRKKLYALACFHYSQGEMDLGNKYLFSDIYVQRALRPRQQGFYLATLALHECLIESYENAITYLNEAAEIFSHIPSYYKIIKHNLELLTRGQFNSSKIEFCQGEEMIKDMYYIDPRCIW